MLALVLAMSTGRSQELYVYTEPASNMATGSIGFRMGSFLMPMNHVDKNAIRIEPEIMFGVSKELMVHVAGYASNMFQNGMRWEGASLYAKYRFLSHDEIHSHFRMAAFGKVAVSGDPAAMSTKVKHTGIDPLGNPYEHYVTKLIGSNELDLNGSHSGVQAGIVATQLKGKMAVSSSVSYINRMNNLNGKNFLPTDVRHAVNFSLSAGYLLLPKEYTDYGQTNFNLYMELLGSKPIDGSGMMLDAAPAVQFIFNSIARLDLGYRFRLSGNINRMNNNSFLLRFEYNWLNAFTRK